MINSVTYNTKAYTTYITHNAIHNYLQYNTITYASNNTNAYTTYSTIR